MKRLLSTILTVFIPVCLLRAEPLEVGTPAPRLIAVNQANEPIDLGALYDEGDVLVYFYPKADTPGCTAQACSLRDAYQALAERGVRIVGVSTDDPESQRAFREKYELPFTLIADTDHEVTQGFGVPLRGSFAARQAFLVSDGTVVWRDLSASTAEQAADVLEALSGIKG